jgi:peptide/nickel transport system substrate-binding protein
MLRNGVIKRIGVPFAALAMSVFGVIGVAPGAPAGASTTYQSQHAGGTLKLLASTAGGTLDPQVNYTLQYWQLYQATYDGLVSFQKALPKVTHAGKTYTFVLRKGIKFSNGKTVTVNDVLA